MVEAMQLPRLSVVLPNYNHGHYLPACLKAMLEQSVPPFEIVAVDDGSKDNSLEILQQFARVHPNLKVHRNDHNRGVVYTLNRGAELARGDYLLLSAADDEVLPGLFEKSLRLLAEYPQAGLCCSVCEWRYVDSGLSWHMAVGMADRPTFYSPDELVQVGRRGKLAISSSSVIMRRDAFQDIGGFVPELRWHSDWFLNYACAFRYGACFVPESLSLVNILAQSHYTAGRRRPEHRKVLGKIMELISSPAFADIRPRVRESAALAVFEFPMLSLLWSHPEYRAFITTAFLRSALWRYAEITGSKFLPRWLARCVLNRLYRLKQIQQGKSSSSSTGRSAG
jgi:glycosyltransferase involved in cell wall biosynthesis